MMITITCMMDHHYMYDDNHYMYDDKPLHVWWSPLHVWWSPLHYDDGHYIMMMAITCMLIGHRGWIRDKRSFWITVPLNFYENTGLGNEQWPVQNLNVAPLVLSSQKAYGPLAKELSMAPLKFITEINLVPYSPFQKSSMTSNFAQNMVRVAA